MPFYDRKRALALLDKWVMRQGDAGKLPFEARRAAQGKCLWVSLPQMDADLLE